MIRFLVVYADIKRNTNFRSGSFASTSLSSYNINNLKPICTGLKFLCKLMDEASKYGGLGGN